MRKFNLWTFWRSILRKAKKRNIRDVSSATTYCTHSRRLSVFIVGRSAIPNAWLPEPKDHRSSLRERHYGAVRIADHAVFVLLLLAILWFVTSAKLVSTSNVEGQEILCRKATRITAKTVWSATCARKSWKTANKATCCWKSGSSVWTAINYRVTIVTSAWRATQMTSRNSNGSTVIDVRDGHTRHVITHFWGLMPNISKTSHRYTTVQSVGARPKGSCSKQSLRFWRSSMSTSILLTLPTKNSSTTSR